MPWRQGREVGPDGDGVVPVPSFPFGNRSALGTGIAVGVRVLRSQNDAFPTSMRFLGIVDIY